MKKVSGKHCEVPVPARLLLRPPHILPLLFFPMGSLHLELCLELSDRRRLSISTHHAAPIVAFPSGSFQHHQGHFLGVPWCYPRLPFCTEHDEKHGRTTDTFYCDRQLTRKTNGSHTEQPASPTGGDKVITRAQGGTTGQHGHYELSRIICVFYAGKE